MMRSAPLLVVCMGVSGAGKSTLAAGLATRLGASFVEADDLHAPAAIEQLRQGRPLSDRDRAPWMRRVTKALNAHLENGRDCVVAHSALRRAHRAELRSLGAETVFFHLHAPQAALARRLKARRDHFMPAALLGSQFEAWQPPRDGEEDLYMLDAMQAPDVVLENAHWILQALPAGVSR